jgi:hypothetical protein
LSELKVVFASSNVLVKPATIESVAPALSSFALSVAFLAASPSELAASAMGFFSPSQATSPEARSPDASTRVATTEDVR